MTGLLRIVLGTRNAKKGIELLDLLDPLGIEVRTLVDFPSAPLVEEDGDTFAANAEKKAVQLARHLGQWVIGEDSGLVVDALGGAPGVYSARYAGEPSNDEANNRKLLAELGDLPLERRTAHYVCHAVVADRTGQIRLRAEGRCQGRIRFAPAGSGGFGYDPLFEIVEYHKTFGELSPAVKAALSHRARALRELAPRLSRLLVEEAGQRG
jgi:XTP/dITP diphosphohydrolase